MDNLRQEAARLGVLFYFGMVSPESVITWADSVIARTETPPNTLLELSSTPSSKTADILSALRQLSTDVDFWCTLRSAFPAIRDFVALHPDKAEMIAYHLYLTACQAEADAVPDDLRFMYGIDDRFALARQGTYGDFPTAYTAFLETLDNVIAEQVEEHQQSSE